MGKDYFSKNTKECYFSIRESFFDMRGNEFYIVDARKFGDNGLVSSTRIISKEDWDSSMKDCWAGSGTTSEGIERLKRKIELEETKVIERFFASDLSEEKLYVYLKTSDGRSFVVSERLWLDTVEKLSETGEISAGTADEEKFTKIFLEMKYGTR